MRARTSDSGRDTTALRWLARLACALALWPAVGALHAAPVFKCVDAQGHVAFRDITCPARTRQTRIDLHALPTIGDVHEVAAAVARAREPVPHHARRATRTRRHSARHARAKPKMSWECRAADGEVFYRHTRCPGSVPGDGVVRWQDGAGSPSGKRSHHRRNAWSRVRVHGVKIPRAEACRRIHSAGAAVRDGHLRDADVSTYDHLMGRDPCGGD
ncbi:MAG TPA: DUF4124 domain-containing protein [Rhodanobacteraceae bacterium]|nr:DUF4124 domain-containing protein [Rhodanobacteraceae bacterium]